MSQALWPSRSSWFSFFLFLVFFVFSVFVCFFCFFFWFCTPPREGCRELSLVICVFLPINAYVKTENMHSPLFCFFWVARKKQMFLFKIITFFPTCQVRVVRFYQSCSPPPRLAVLLLVLLLASSSSFSSTMFASTSTCTSALPTLRQAICQLSVCTAAPQPGTFPAQCAPLDLNLGPSQLGVHRWTSTWDLPSSVCTAGPQPGTCPAQCAPLDLNGQIECQIEFR